MSCATAGVTSPKGVRSPRSWGVWWYSTKSHLQTSLLWEKLSTFCSKVKPKRFKEKKINNNNNLASCFPPEHILHYSSTQTKHWGPLQIFLSILDFYLGIIFKDFPNKSLVKHMSALWQGWLFLFFFFPELELNLKIEIGLINYFRWKKRAGFQHRAEMKQCKKQWLEISSQQGGQGTWALPGMEHPLDKA